VEQPERERLPRGSRRRRSWPGSPKAWSTARDRSPSSPTEARATSGPGGEERAVEGLRRGGRGRARRAGERAAARSTRSARRWWRSRTTRPTTPAREAASTTTGTSRWTRA
jgi:hypothetical protein